MKPQLTLYQLLSTVILLFKTAEVESVRLRDLSIPSYRFRDSDATLACNFDLEGERLYSVKWYKDGHEFFRYIPADPDQKVTTFNLPGVNINRQLSDKNQVTLENLNLNSAGQYRCEISAEAPLFNTVAQSKKLNVIVLPRSGPRISGGKSIYHVGDRVSVNCTSERSKPAATLHWSINNQAASDHLVRHYPPIQHEDGLETSILGLDFEVTPSTFSSPSARKNRYDVNDANNEKNAGRNQGTASTTFLTSSSSSLSLTLRCSSTVSTVNTEAQITETHHQKESVHFSYGSLFFSSSPRGNSSSSLIAIAVLISSLLSNFPMFQIFQKNTSTNQR